MKTGGIADRVKREYGDLTYRIIGAAMIVHKMLGPGFPEVFYFRPSIYSKRFPISQPAVVR